MAPEKPTATANGAEEADLAKAFQELAKGERTAAVLEKQLSTMEAKIDALLAQAEREQENMQRMREAQVNAGAEQGRSDTTTTGSP